MKTLISIAALLSSLLLTTKPEAEVASQSTPNPPSVNEPVLLDNAGLRKAFVGKTHVGFYRDYIERYGSIKFVEKYLTDGSLRYQGGGTNLTGTWEITDNNICFDYDDDDFIPGCFAVIEKQGCYYSYESNLRSDGKSTRQKDWWIFSFVEGTKVECEEAELIS